MAADYRHIGAVRIGLVGTTADFRRFDPPRPLQVNHLPCENCAMLGRIGEVGLAMFAIRVSYPGGHSVWLTRRFPTVAWGLKKDALPFPTEADAARTIARLRPSGPVSIEPIAPEIAKPA